MKKELVLFFVFVLIGIGFVSADSSYSDTNFSVGGISDECSADGYIYYASDSTPLDTFVPGVGCSRGESSYTSGSALGPCCPVGYDCKGTSPGSEQFECVLSVVTCDKEMDEEECESEEVDGYYYDDDCICVRSDVGCDIYKDNDSCSDDSMRLGSRGLGSEDCVTTVIECNGTTFIVGDCSCVWDSGEESCLLGENVVQAQYATGSIPNGFSCLKSSETGDCIDGLQDVIWTTKTERVSGFDEVPEDCLNASGCVGGPSTYSCGEPLIKLPGFSLFSLFFSFGIVMLFYFFRENEQSLNSK